MKFKILTIFPDMFAPLKQSVIGRAQICGAIEIDIVDIRSYSKCKHRKVDDEPYGGGAGMVMTCQPIFDAIQAVDPYHEYLRVYLSPKGEVLKHSLSKDLSKNHDKILLLCGHYEGVDQRIIDLMIDKEISIGDFVLTGGELAAMVFVDAVSRHIGGVLGNEESSQDESFSSNLLEYPQYTRPFEFMGQKVPEILLGGHHANIEKWRNEQSKITTKEKRPDLLGD
ncbi:MAG: tRNA (guanosine(37)-N1)-methyltransferase TrmD [Firmicutes bacterium]|nr:tRNA (guanosine(37)-N1)-methyltransferase TrmD [Bacillota bacterium]